MKNQDHIIAAIDEAGIKQLPIYFPPPITYALFAANKLSMALMHESGFNWLYNNFIQLAFYPQFLEPLDSSQHCVVIMAAEALKPRFACAGLLLHETMLDNYVKKFDPDTIIDEMISWLDGNLYIQSHIDVTKLTTTRYAGQEPFSHSSLIFGYDKQKKCFRHLDFLDSGRLEIIDIPFADYVSAFFSPELEEIFIKKKNKNVKHVMTLTRLNLDEHIELSPITIKFWVKDFLDCAPSNKKLDMFYWTYDMVSGFDVYPAMIEFAKRLQAEFGYIQYKMLHAVYDHKKLMAMRIKKLEDMSLLDPGLGLLKQANELFDTADIMRMQVLKSYRKPNPEIAGFLEARVNEMSQSERRLMETLYSHL